MGTRFQRAVSTGADNLNSKLARSAEEDQLLEGICTPSPGQGKRALPSGAAAVMHASVPPASVAFASVVPQDRSCCIINFRCTSLVLFRTSQPSTLTIIHMLQWGWASTIHLCTWILRSLVLLMMCPAPLQLRNQVHMQWHPSVNIPQLAAHAGSHSRCII